MRTDKDDTKKKIPMRELEKLTNMTRATINFYIKEGLLPTPHKSAKNMAYYDEDFIEKLKYIEKMRNADFTLTQIKKLIHMESSTVNDYTLQVLESVNKLLPYDVEEKQISIDKIRKIGFSDEEINNLIHLGIIISDNKSDSLFPAYSITVCKFVKYYVDLGVPLSVIKEILDKLHELADMEKNVFINYIRSPMVANNISAEEQRKEVQKCIENINGLLPILHLQLIKQPSENLLKLESQ